VKILIILRHATSAQRGPDGTDFSRPLTALGRDEARVQGGFLREAGIVPEVIVASAAVRAATTAELVASSLRSAPPLALDGTLYNALGDTLLDHVRGLPDGAHTALVVAHMPGVAELLSLLAGDLKDRSVAFAPGTLVCVALGPLRRWAEVEPGSGAVEWVVPPLLLR
jgi:phosphohistidine phosphatase